MDTLEQLVARANPVLRAEPADPALVARVLQDALTGPGHDKSPNPHEHRHRYGTRAKVLIVGAALTAAVAVPVALSVLPGAKTTAPAAAEPALWLKQAADAVPIDSSAAVPRPDQFVYAQNDSQQTWLSVDGTRDGLTRNPDDMTIPGCSNGTMLVAGNYQGEREQPCTPSPAYLADVPTDPDTLKVWLDARAHGVNEKNVQADPSAVNAVAKTTLSLLTTYYVDPPVRRALFEVIAGYPGLAMVRRGLPSGDIGVAWSFGGGTTTLVFDQSTHAFLGTAMPTDGDITVTTMRIVDRPGQTS